MEKKISLTKKKGRKKKKIVIRKPASLEREGEGIALEEGGWGFSKLKKKELISFCGFLLGEKKPKRRETSLREEG